MLGRPLDSAGWEGRSQPWGRQQASGPSLTSRSVVGLGLEGGVSWSTCSVHARLRKFHGCLTAHSAVKQKLDFETAPGMLNATTQCGEHWFPPAGTGRRPTCDLKLLPSVPTIFTPVHMPVPVTHEG